ncbi:MAG TPA: hypothetical protein VGK67_00920 [Myxococcales bacterium]|jgi:hypothetical protein
MARAALAAAWAAAITAGAVALHYARLPGKLGDLASYEPAHVVAHVLLYGVLAALVAAWLRGWSWKVFALVLAVGFVQEACQTLVFGIPMGAHEAKDLTTDLLGCAGALLAARAWRRLMRARSPKPVARSP